MRRHIYLIILGDDGMAKKGKGKAVAKGTRV
jgi:hypothetical protein